VRERGGRDEGGRRVLAKEEHASGTGPLPASQLVRPGERDALLLKEHTPVPKQRRSVRDADLVVPRSCAGEPSNHDLPVVGEAVDPGAVTNDDTAGHEGACDGVGAPEGDTGSHVPLDQGSQPAEVGREREARETPVGVNHHAPRVRVHASSSTIHQTPRGVILLERMRSTFVIIEHVIYKKI